MRALDFEQFLRILRREKPADRLPFYEHLASPGFMSARVGVDVAQLDWNTREAWKLYVDFWVGMGFDAIPIEVPPALPLPSHEIRTTQVSQGSEAHAIIRTCEDFERYPWPNPEYAVSMLPFEYAAMALPEGAKLVAGVSAGPFEWASQLMGLEGISVAVYLQPDLVHEVFHKLGVIHTTAMRQIASLEAVGACRQGDDLGFKTSTFLAPDQLKAYIFPIYKEMAEISHQAGKPFIFHSCGNLEALYDDLIEYCKIDAKHSFEDVIVPVTEFKKHYGTRVTPLGGLDVDYLCRASEPDLRRYVRKTAEICFADGFWALGTGNSLTDYLPLKNYLIVLDEGTTI